MYPNCMPDIMILAQAILQIFCWQCCFTTQNASQKREKSQPNIHRILPKVTQVIYTMATVYTPNIMVRAQAVIQIFRWQGSTGLQCVSRKREIIQPNSHRILRKVNQVIYTLDIILVSNIMILAQVVLQILCWKDPLWVKCLSLKRGEKSVKYSQNFTKS